MKVKPDNKKLFYSGRIDWSNKEEPIFVYPCTSVEMRFSGNKLKIYVKNHRAYWNNMLGCVIDGIQMKFPLSDEKSDIFSVPLQKTENNEHDVLLFKRQDACHELGFLGFEIEDGAQVLDLPEKPFRKIEIYGDSVSAGDVSEAMANVGREDPKHNGEYSNAWYSYAWILARRLKAQIYDVAQGGAALMDGYGWFHGPDYIGMETIWDKIHYNPELSKPMEWNFQNYTPQLVIIEIGQNDSNPCDYMKNDYYGEKAENWKNHYRRFIEKIREHYPAARIICCTTIIYHDQNWDRAIGQVIKPELFMSI